MFLELVSYVHSVSPVKKAKRSGIEYFNFKVQTENNVHEGVSFNVNIKEPLDDASAQKSPVKIKHFKQKANYRDNSKTDIELSQKSSVTLLRDTSLPYRNCPDQHPKIQSINNIFKDCCDKQIVSVCGYLNSENCFITEMIESCRKDVYLNDASGIITLSIWGPSIEKISKDGVYNIFNLTVREITTLEGNQLILNATDSTKFEVPTKSTKIQKMKPTFELFKTVHFPISACCPGVTQLKCRCGKIAVPIQQTNFYRCPSCKVSSRYSSLKTIRSYKLSFPGHEVTIYQKQLECFMARQGVPNNDDNLLEAAFFQDENTKVIINRNNSVVCFN